MKDLFRFLGIFMGPRRTSMGGGNMFFKFVNARENTTLTNFLVSNPLFRSLALGFHNKKVDTMDQIDKYLEKELLDKDTYD